MESYLLSKFTNNWICKVSAHPKLHQKIYWKLYKNFYLTWNKLDRAVRKTVCRTLGHSNKHDHKMYCTLCSRCYTVLSNKPQLKIPVKLYPGPTERKDNEDY